MALKTSDKELSLNNEILFLCGMWQPHPADMRIIIFTEVRRNKFYLSIILQEFDVASPIAVSVSLHILLFICRHYEIICEIGSRNTASHSLAFNIHHGIVNGTDAIGNSVSLFFGRHRGFILIRLFAPIKYESPYPISRTSMTNGLPLFKRIPVTSTLF